MIHRFKILNFLSSYIMSLEPSEKESKTEQEMPFFKHRDLKFVLIEKYGFRHTQPGRAISTTDQWRALRMTTNHYDRGKEKTSNQLISHSVSVPRIPREVRKSISTSKQIILSLTDSFIAISQKRLNVRT